MSLPSNFWLGRKDLQFLSFQFAKVFCALVFITDYKNLATTTTAATRTLTKHEKTIFITITPFTPSIYLQWNLDHESLYNERFSSARPKLHNRVVSRSISLIIEDLVVSYTFKVEIPVSSYLKVILRGVFVFGSQVFVFYPPRSLLREEVNDEQQGSHKVRRLAIRDRISSTIKD